MSAMRLVECAPRILNRRAQVLGRELVLLLLHALAPCVTKKEADHHVVERAIDEAVDDAPQDGLAAEVVEQGRGHQRSQRSAIRAAGEADPSAFSAGCAAVECAAALADCSDRAGWLRAILARRRRCRPSAAARRPKPRANR